MTDVEARADAFLEALGLDIAEADASGVPPVAVARLLFGVGVLLLEERDGPERALRALRHQTARIARAAAVSRPPLPKRKD